MKTCSGVSLIAWNRYVKVKVSIMSKKEKNAEKKPYRHSHAYGAIVGGLNFEVKNDHRNIAEQLNFIKDNLEKFLSDSRSIHKIIKEDSSILNQKQGLQAAATVWFVRWFLGKFRVKTFIATLEANPAGNRTGKELYEEYLRKDELISKIEPSLYDQERLLLFDEAIKDGKIVGGLSFFKIFQHTYSLVKALQKKFGDKAIHVSRIEKFADEPKAEKMLIVLAKEMHKAKANNKAETKEPNTDTDEESASTMHVEEISSEFVESQTSVDEILAMLESGELSASDLESVEKIDEVYPNASSGVKGALTRRKKALV